MVCLKTVGVSTDENKHGYDVSAVCANDKYVFSGSEEGVIKMWNSSDLTLVKEWRAHDYGILHLVIGGNVLYSSSMDSLIKVWQIPDMNLHQTLEGHEEPVKRMFYRGNDLLAGDYEGKLNVWGLDGNVKCFYGLSEEVWGLHAQDKLIYFVRDRGLSVIEAHENSDKYVVMSSIEGRAPIYVHGKTFIITDKSGTSATVLDNCPKVYTVKGELKGHEKLINAITGWGEDLVVTGGYDDHLKVWDVKTCQEVCSAPVPGCVYDLCTTPDGGLAVGCEDGVVMKMMKQ